MAKKNYLVDLDLNEQRIKRGQFEESSPLFDGHETRTLLERLVRLNNQIKSYLFRGDSIGLLGDVDVTTNPPMQDQALVYDGTNWIPHGKTTHLIHNSGRFYLNTGLSWVTDSDDNYGTTYYQFAEGAGTSAEPVIEWEHMGMLMEKGRVIKSLNMMGRANSLEVDDVELRLIAKWPNDPTLWQTGMNSDIQVNTQTLYAGNFRDASMTGPSNYLMRRKFTFSEFTMPEDGHLSIYMRPITSTSITARRYFRTSYAWEYE